MRIAQIGRWLNNGLFGDSAILALVDFVHGKLDELVSISTRSDLHAQYIHCLQTSKRLRFEIKPGDVRPLALSGIGRTLLSGHTDVEIARLLRRMSAVCPPEEHIELDALMKIHQRHPARRLHVLQAHHRPGRGVITVLLPKRDIGRDLVLGVGGPVSHLEERQEENLGFYSRRDREVSDLTSIVRQTPKNSG